MFTLTQLQNIVHRIYEGNTSYPTEGSEDWDLRLGYMNDAISLWANEKGINWRQLFINLSDASTGDKTTVSTQTSYDLPDDFMWISSLVNVGGTYLQEIKHDEVMNALRNNSNSPFFYITGDSSGGNVLNINPAPTAGLTIDYSYYKEPTLLAAAANKPEMTKPYFIVYMTLARLYEQDLRNDLVTFYEDKAKNIMDEMVIENEIAPFNTSYALKDYDSDIFGGGFGRHE